MDNDLLLKKSDLIINNIESKGFARFDPRDIRFYDFNVPQFIHRYFRYGILLLEQFCPFMVRKMLNISPQNIPTAYTHVAEAYLLAEKNDIKLTNKNSSLEICESGLKQFYIENEEDAYWPGVLNKDFCVIAEKYHARPYLDMHRLARYNILLLDLGKFYHIQKYIEIACKTALDTIQLYSLNFYPDGIVSIPYLYNSDDCVLNVNTEFAQWLSMIPEEYQNEKFKEIVNGIIRLMISEQNEDGSWKYYSKEHVRRYKVVENGIDCNHTATLFTNMLNVLKYPVLDSRLRVVLLESVNKGMRFFKDTFFDPQTGKAKAILGHRRPAGPVEYSEAVFAFYEYCLSKEVDVNLQKEIYSLLPKVIGQIASLINNDGSSPCDRVIKWVNIDSIRWGNGPALQAFMCFLALQNRNRK